MKYRLKFKKFCKENFDNYGAEGTFMEVVDFKAKDDKEAIGLVKKRYSDGGKPFELFRQIKKW